MAQKFLALAKANIQERIDFDDELITAYSDAVYENGYTFSGEVLICGVVHPETDEETLGAILIDYLKDYTDFVQIIKVEFRGEAIKVKNEYRRTG